MDCFTELKIEQQCPERLVGFKRMPERSLRVHMVAIASSRTVTRQVSGIDQIGNNPLHSAFGYSDLWGNVPDP